MLAARSHAQAAGWYAGLEAGQRNLTFEPQYTFVDGRPPTSFTNRTDGPRFDLLVGRRAVLNDRWTLGIEAGAGISTAEWTLRLVEDDEPSEFAYSLPFDVRVSVVPEMRLTDRVALLARLGGGMGRVREAKTSTTRSSYDFDKLQPTYALGGGVQFAFSERFGVRAEYRWQSYSSFSFDTFGPSGARVEHVTDAPVMQGFSLGITRRF